MITALIRIPLTLLFAYLLVRFTMRSPELSGGDMIFLMAYGLFGGVIVAILWAPVIGEKLSDPLTSAITEETSLPPHAGRLVGAIHRLQRRGFHRPALLLVFLEGMRRPDLPQAALLGLRSSRPGSFLEKCFAREVYKFNNIQNCLYAYKVLTERHGTTPPLHQQHEVNLAILNLSRVRPPEPAKLQIISQPAPSTPERNQRIKLFEQAEPKPQAEQSSAGRNPEHSSSET
jgi:hypothetical protein